MRVSLSKPVADKIVRGLCPSSHFHYIFTRWRDGHASVQEYLMGKDEVTLSVKMTKSQWLSLLGELYEIEDDLDINEFMVELIQALAEYEDDICVE